MATTTNNANSTLPSPSWALPIAATILVAGSLIFWTCLGLFWLATRQPVQQPIVIWMPPSASSSAADETSFAHLQSASALRDR